MSEHPSPSDSIAENSGELVLELSNILLNLNLNNEEISTQKHFNNNCKTSLSKNLVLKNNSCKEMAPPAFDTKLFNIVPQFDGNPLELAAYLDTASMLINTYWDVNPVNLNCTQNILLIYGIYAKLSGFAKEVYSTTISKDWASVKNALIAHFGDHRDESGLLSDLCSLKQNHNEPPLHFLQRIMSNLNALHNYIDTHEQVEANKIVRKTFYNNHCLNVFLSGLKEPLGSIIRAMKPNDLATARQYIVTENNIRHIQKTPNHFQNNTNFQNNVKQNPNYIHKPQNSQHFNTRPQFPSQPIHINPRPVAPQRFFTNKQVFGKPQNAWKPQGSHNNYPKPVPMSGVSHGTSFARQNKAPTNIFKNQRPNPNIIVEELYNLEPVDDSQQYENYYYPEQDSEYFTENESLTNENYCTQDDTNEQNFQIVETPPIDS